MAFAAGVDDIRLSNVMPIKLNGDNFHHWKFQMKMMLKGKDLWDIVTGDEVLDEETATEKEKKDFKKREQNALSQICLSIVNRLQIYVHSAATSKEY